jgi:hypothetical protein
MEEMTILSTIEWSQHPIEVCAGQPIIPATEFFELSHDLAEFDDIKLTAEEIETILGEQSKRFSACGANNADPKRFACVRKNPKTGWNYLIDIFLGKTEKPE